MKQKTYGRIREYSKKQRSQVRTLGVPATVAFSRPLVNTFLFLFDIFVKELFIQILLTIWVATNKRLPSWKFKGTFMKEKYIGRHHTNNFETYVWCKWRSELCKQGISSNVLILSNKFHGEILKRMYLSSNLTEWGFTLENKQLNQYLFIRCLHNIWYYWFYNWPLWVSVYLFCSNLILKIKLNTSNPLLIYLKWVNHLFVFTKILFMWLS